MPKTGMALGKASDSSGAFFFALAPFYDELRRLRSNTATNRQNLNANAFSIASPIHPMKLQHPQNSQWQRSRLFQINHQHRKKKDK